MKVETDKRLVQAIIPEAVFVKMKRKADEEGLSIAAYVRRLILRDVKRDKKA